MKSYKTYTPVDFAQEQSFINWVLRENKRDVNFWEVWVKNHPERSEEIDQARQIVLSFQFKQDGITQKRADDLWARIDEQTADAKLIVRSRRFWIQVAGVAAAAITGLFVTWSFFNGPDYEYITQNADWEKIELPDASQVHLNAGSALTFDQDWSESRVVSLEGEAFFEVEKGNSFEVITPNGTVKVLGTSFNVFSRGTFFDVQCNTGQVRVTDKSGDKKTIGPGQEAFLGPNGLEVKEFAPHPNNYASWIEGQHDIPENTF